MRNQPFVLILILSLLSTFTGACDRVEDRGAQVVAIDAPLESPVDAAEDADAPEPTGPCAGAGSDSASQEPCADCIEGVMAAGDPCDPITAEEAAEQCGADPSVFAFGGFKCARALGIAAFSAVTVVGSAIAVGLACTAGQAAPVAGQLACVAAVLALIGTSGLYVITLLDIVTDCPWARARVCGMIRNLLANLQAAVAGMNAFIAALPPAVANQPIANFFAGNARLRALVMQKFPGLTVGQALNAMVAELNGQIAQLQGALNNQCAGN